MQLCGSEEDILKEAERNGILNDQDVYRVNYCDIFSSPWCCDSSHEDRYEVLMQEVSVSLASIFCKDDLFLFLHTDAQLRP